MRVFSVLASPRIKGNTSVVLKRFLEGVRENHSGVEEYTAILHEKSIKPCMACDNCKTGPKVCVISDDMQQLYREVEAADVIVLATPIYWWNMTAQLKTFIDRLYAMDFEKSFKGKRLVLLMTYGGEDPNSGAEIVEKSFREICEFLSMEFTGKFGLCSENPIELRERSLEEAYSLGRKL